MARYQFQNTNIKYPLSTRNRDLLRNTLNDIVALLDVIDPAAVQATINGIVVTTGGGLINPIYTAGQAWTPSGMKLLLSIALADAATQNVDFIVSKKVEIIDCTCIKTTAGAGNTVQLANGTVATPITDAMATAVDGAITRAATMTTANSTIAAGGTLRLISTKAAGSQQVRVNIEMVLRA